MILGFEDFELDTELFELRKSGALLKVEPQVFDFLKFLVTNNGRVVTKDELIEEIWDGRIVSEATLSTCAKAARQALGDDGRAQRLIKTVHGRGFRFVGDVSDPRRAEAPHVPSTPSAPSPAPSSVKPVIAVLPFDNLSAEADSYFADGLTEDIITNLARFRDLLVIARTSTFQFKGQPTDLKDVGARLGAGYVVEGSVRRAGGRVRINVQLIDAGTGHHLWADHYDRDMEDIFAVQDEVTRTIAATLGVKMQDVALQRALKKSPAELDAYDCVLRARRFTASLTAELHAEARDLLEKAVELDPSSADAHALLANIYLAEHRIGLNPRPNPVDRALAVAQRATELDPENAYARCWLAIVHFFRHENDRFEAEAERALALNPNDPETLADVGHYFAFMGQFERGIELSARARQLNPLHPGWYYFSFARHHYMEQAYDRALADIERIGMPHFYWQHILRAATLGQLGRENAPEALKKIYDLKPDFDAETELVKWNAAPSDMAHIIDGLKKAGLKA